MDTTSPIGWKRQKILVAALFYERETGTGATPHTLLEMTRLEQRKFAWCLESLRKRKLVRTNPETKLIDVTDKGRRASLGFDLRLERRR